MIETMKGKKIYTEYEQGYKQGVEDALDQAIRILEKRAELGECDSEVIERIERLKENNG